MIAALLFLLVALGAFAYCEARQDYQRIKAHEPIDHFGALLDRVMVGACLWAMAAAIGMAQQVELSRSLWLIPVGWGWWTMAFRLALNSLRGLDWRYISPSSLYDWQFLRLFYFGHLKRGEWIDSWSMWSRNESARRAGMLAYTFEAIVILVWLAGYLLR